MNFRDAFFRQNRLGRLTLLNATFLTGLWFLETFIAERTWPTMLLTFVPQYGFLLPAILLSVLCLRAKERKFLAVNAAAFVLAVFALCDVTTPFGALWQSPGLPGTKLRVMTLNTHHGINGVQGIVDLVHEQQPDVLCLQEAVAIKTTPDPVPELRRLLPEWHFAQLKELVIFSRLPIVMQSGHVLRDKGFSGVLQVTVENNLEMIDIFNIHVACPITKASLSDIVKRMPVRQRQIESLLQIVSSSVHPSVIAGDFNTPPRGLIYQNLLNHFTDAQRSATWGITNTFHSALPLIRIDYLWLTRGLMAEECTVVKRRASDHRAVVADLALTAQ